MSLGFTSHLNDPDLDRVSAALLRAGQRARELARQTGTGIAVQIDGELRILQGADLDRASKNEVTTEAPALEDAARMAERRSTGREGQP